MSSVVSDQEKINKLVEYYKNKGLLIVGMNDSQGVNTTSTFFKKGLLEYLAASLTSKELTPEVINAFSLLMNKSEHVDYFLKHNLSLKEIKLSQVYSVVGALSKVMEDLGLPQTLGNIGNVYKLIYTPKNGDENIKITSSLKSADEPVFIYSSGVNNLMREVGSNPFGIKNAYKNRYKKPDYNYTLEKANDPKTLRKVIDSINRNFDNILNINSSTDIYTLGAYIPKSLQSEKMNIFRDLVIAYNEELINLCKQYNITFVDTKEVGKKYNNSETNFHISTQGHNALANYILGHMYQNKFVLNNKAKINNLQEFEILDDGACGMIASLNNDLYESYDKSFGLYGYPKKREEAILKEHTRELDVFEKVLRKK